MAPPGELEVVALPDHTHRDPSDTGPRIKPRVRRPKRMVIGQTREPGESERCPEELATLVDHGRVLPVTHWTMKTPLRHARGSRVPDKVHRGSLQAPPRSY